MLIPKIIHRTRLGDDTLPEECDRFMANWIRFHPGWEERLWTPQNLPPLLNDKVYHLSPNLGHRSDILRYELLYRFGGVYVDLDFDCCSSLEPLLAGVTCFLGRIAPTMTDLGVQTIETAIMGSVPGHPFLEQVISNLAPWARQHWGAYSPVRTGPQYVQKQLVQWSADWREKNPAVNPPITLFPPETFYPFLWTQKERAHEPFLSAVGIHHWWGSWNRRAQRILPTVQ